MCKSLVCLYSGRAGPLNSKVTGLSAVDLARAWPQSLIWNLKILKYYANHQTSLPGRLGILGTIQNAGQDRRETDPRTALTGPLNTATTIVAARPPKPALIRQDSRQIAMASGIPCGGSPQEAPKLLSTPPAVPEEVHLALTFAVEDEAEAELGPPETRAGIVGGIAI